MFGLEIGRDERGSDGRSLEHSGKPAISAFAVVSDQGATAECRSNSIFQGPSIERADLPDALQDLGDRQRLRGFQQYLSDQRGYARFALMMFHGLSGSIRGESIPRADGCGTEQ